MGKIQCVCLLLCALLPPCIFATGVDDVQSPKGTLINAIILVRHGERTPLVELPKDPHALESAWPVGVGQLLNPGKLRLFNVGQYFRQRYTDFLPDAYSENDIYVRSTNVDRTLMSAYCLLAGLYPPTADQTWHQNLHWQPIPVHTTFKDHDAILSMDKNCPQRNHLQEQLYASGKFHDALIETKELFAILSEKTGYPVKNFKGLGDVYFTWVIEETLLNYTTPDWSKYYKDEAYRRFLLHFQEQTFTEELARLKTGPWFNEILTIFESAAQKVTPRKLTLFSAHDITIANVLNSLHLFHPHIPDYGSALIFELRATSGPNDHYVNLFYRNSSGAPTPLALRNCTFNCPLANFTRLIQPLRITEEEWDGECEMKLLGLISTKSNHDVIVACTTLVAIFVIIATIFICFMYSRKRKGVDLPSSTCHYQK